MSKTILNHFPYPNFQLDLIYSETTFEINSMPLMGWIQKEILPFGQKRH